MDESYDLETHFSDLSIIDHYSNWWRRSPIIEGITVALRTTVNILNIDIYLMYADSFVS